MAVAATAVVVFIAAAWPSMVAAFAAATRRCMAAAPPDMAGMAAGTSLAATADTAMAADTAIMAASASWVSASRQPVIPDTAHPITINTDIAGPATPSAGKQYSEWINPTGRSTLPLSARLPTLTRGYITVSSTHLR